MRNTKPNRGSFIIFLVILVIFSLTLDPILAIGGQKYSNIGKKIKEKKNNEYPTVSQSVYQEDSIVKFQGGIFSNYETDRFIIKYKNNKSKSNFNGTFKKSLMATMKLNNNKAKSDKFEVIVTKKKMKQSQLLSELRSENKDADIEYIQPDYKLSIASTDQYFDYQWGVYNKDILTTTSYKETVGIAVYEEVYQEISFRIDAAVLGAWSVAQGDGVTVAVIDTGVDITHEDLSKNIWKNTEEIPDNGLDDDMNGYIDDVNGWNFLENNNKVYDASLGHEEWHGTHVAGIIAGIKDNEKGVAGVAPESEMLPLKVFSKGTAYTSDIMEAIAYAETMGAKVVNCSFGGADENPALREAIEASEMVFVTAAGNSNINIDETPVYPASYDSPNIITVSAINKHGILSAFSNYGKSTVEVAAPGESILSTLPNNQYGYSSGTSMASAFVSGEAALILSKYGEISPEDIKEKIISTSDRLSSLLGKIYRGNKINSKNAVLDMNLNTHEIITIDESGSVTESVYQSVYGVGTYTLFSIDFQSIDLNTTTLEAHSDTLRLLLDEVKILKKLIKAIEEAKERTKAINNNIEAISNHNETIKMISAEIDALREMIKFSSKSNKINANIEAIRQHALTLNMLLRELKAANDLIIIKNENTTVNCTKDKVFNLIFTGNNLTQGSGDINYTITYNKEEIEAIDLYGLTSEEELTIGEIPETGITITEFDPSKGKIKFTVKNNIASGKAWTGILNSIKFKAKQTGSTEIKTNISHR